jgi:hypothetical protein
MRALLLLALAACTESGVSSNPQDWDVAVGRFANAWCDWNATCGTKHDATCVDEVTSIMNEQTRPELATDSEDACVSCMGAWTDVLDADLSPCAASLTSDQQQAVTAACVVNCIENHDLPGTSPQ